MSVVGYRVDLATSDYLFYGVDACEPPHASDSGVLTVRARDRDRRLIAQFARHGWIMWSEVEQS